MKRVLCIVFLLSIFNLSLLAQMKQKLIKNINHTNLVNVTHIENQCLIENCLSCNDDLNRTCGKCEENYILEDGKCYNQQKLAIFMNDLKKSVNYKEQNVIDFVMKNILPNPNSDQEILNHPFLKFESITKDFNTIRELLNNLQEVNQRECKMKINEFMVDFEQNIQVLLSLANLFEQKTVFEIEKQRNSIMQIINSDVISPQVKLDMVNNKLENLTKMIFDTFEEIKNRIKNYEEISEKKIARTRHSFMLKFKKFLE